MGSRSVNHAGRCLWAFESADMGLCYQLGDGPNKLLYGSKKVVPGQSTMRSPAPRHVGAVKCRPGGMMVPGHWQGIWRYL